MQTANERGAAMGVTSLPSMFLSYLKFCAVGGSGVIVDMAMLYFMLEVGCGITLSKCVAAEVAMTSNFVWNDLWTFQMRGCGAIRGRLIRFLKFNLICTLGLIAGTILLNVQVLHYGVNVYVANFASIILVSVSNYALSRQFGWAPG